jgi:VanZ family protein
MNNLLLFTPWGFGLAAMARSRRLPPIIATLFIFLLGATLSLCIEISQCWLPDRDPSLFDVAANSGGSALGAVGYLAGGYRVFTRQKVTVPKRTVVTNVL